MQEFNVDKEECILELEPFLTEKVNESCFRKRLAYLEKGRWLWIVHAILFLGWLALLAANIARKPVNISDCVTKQSYYSPVLPLVDEDYSIRHFNSSDTTYRGPPSKVVDEAWKNLTQVYPFPMSLEDLEKVGADPKKSTKLPAELGGGYEAMLSMSHELHCIKILWQHTHYDYYRTRNELFRVTSPDLLHGHLDHCADLLRQSTLCHADVSIITFEWREGFDNPRAQYGNPRKCRNYEELQRWIDVHQAPVPPGNRIPKPADT